MDATDTEQNLLEIRHLNKAFWKRGRRLQALKDITLNIRAGECVGMVGQSGSGKSTLARLLCRIYEPDEGKVLFQGQDAFALKSRDYYRQVQMVFQDPLASCPPRMRVERFLLEPFRNFRLLAGRNPRELARELLARVHLGEELLPRYPGQLSGGQMQRVVFARATGLSPRLLICDEATSALDTTIQAQVVALLQELRRQIGFACLFITHDLALAESLCDTIYVMADGAIAERLSSGNMAAEAKAPATLSLLAACRAFSDLGAFTSSRGCT